MVIKIEIDDGDAFKRNKDYSLLNNARFKDAESFVSIKTGQDIWLHIFKKYIINVDSIILDDSQKDGYILEDKDIYLNENDSVKRISFVFNVGEENEVLTSNYDIILNLGDYRKN